ncbi:MAG: ankyrin repeat domain-containing protein, partial [Gammaproteobacteria bacterium]
MITRNVIKPLLLNPLFQACSNGDLNQVKAHIESGESVNQCDAYGINPLWIASRKGHLDIVKFLVAHGGAINHRDSRTLSPLFVASLYGCFAIVVFLVGNGADLNQHLDDGISPLWIAAQMRHLDVARFLIEHGAEVNNVSSPLELFEFLCSKNHLEAARIFIEEYGDTVALNEVFNRLIESKVPQDDQLESVLTSYLISNQELLDKASEAGIALEVPDDYLCNISSVIMDKPMLDRRHPEITFRADYGPYSDWLEKKATNPILGSSDMQMTTSHLKLDKPLKKQIDLFVFSVLKQLRKVPGYENAFESKYQYLLAL